MANNRGNFNTSVRNLYNVVKGVNFFSVETGGGFILYHYYRICKEILGQSRLKNLKELNCAPSMAEMDLEDSILSELRFSAHFYLKQGVQLKLSRNIRKRLKDLHNYGRFAISAYGVYMLLTDPKSVSICCCCCIKPKELKNTEESSYGWNYASIKNYIYSLKSTDTTPEILMTTLDTNKTPCSFVASFFEAKKELVIAIQGTTGIKDILVDLDFDQCEIDASLITEFGGGHYSHKGVLMASIYLFKKIANCERIKSLFGEQKVETLTMTGHSLGGAIATLTALFLRGYLKTFFGGKGIKAICYAFGPPKFLDKELAQHPITKKIITSIVFNSDIIPRLSQSTFRAYLITMRVLVERSKKSVRGIFKGRRQTLARIVELNLFLRKMCLEGSCPGTFCKAQLSGKRRRGPKIGKALCAPKLSAERVDALSEKYRTIATEFLRNFDDSVDKEMFEQMSDIVIKEKLRIIIEAIEKSVAESSRQNGISESFYLSGTIVNVLDSPHGDGIESRCCRPPTPGEKSHYVVYESSAEEFANVCGSYRAYSDHIPVNYRTMLEFLANNWH